MLYLGLYGLSLVFSPEVSHAQPNLMGLLKGPEFPPLADICPHCLVVQDPTK